MTVKLIGIQHNLSMKHHKRFLEDCPRYSYFHTPDWVHVLVSSYPTYQNATRLFGFSDGTEILFPLIRVRKLKGLVSTYHSMPFHTYGGFLISKPATQQPDLSEKTQLIEENLAGIHAYKFTITPFPRDENSLVYSSFRNSHTNIPLSTQILPLENGYDWVWEQRFDSKNRNQIRKARKSGLTIMENYPDAGNIYWELYRESSESRKGNKGIRYPHKLFLELAKSMEHVKFYFAIWNEKPIAGIIVLYGNKTAMYWNAAVLPEGKTICANQLLLDQAIQDAVIRGILEFDFGASPGMESVYHFKTAFGPENVDYTILEFRKLHR